MALKKKLEIFRPGTFVSESGKTYTFSEADIKASVAAYDPELSKAPLVVGHPKTDDPAFGWVSGISFAEDIKKVLAEPDQVDPSFAELVNEGKYPKISASFYHPDNPSNPVPGVYYLRHVGFLGAAAPAVKGLRVASFADDDSEVVTIEFSEGEQQSRWALAKFMRGMRDFMISKFGLETADQVVPDYVVSSAEDAERASRQHTAFSEPEDNAVNKDDQTASFAEREGALNAREQALVEREKKIAIEQNKRRLIETADFVEGLVKEGKVLPAEKEKLVSFMAALGDDLTISFAEGDEQQQAPAGDFLREFLKALPARVDFSERSAPEDDSEQVASFAAPRGFTVGQERLALHNKAIAYSVKHKCDYITAVAALEK